MKTMTALCILGLATVLLLSGCDRFPGMGPGALVVDLSVAAKAMGQDQVMQEQSQAAREELNVQLAESAQNLEQQLAQERDGLGESPTPEQQQQLQQMALQAQQRYAQLQAEAQQNMEQYEVNLVLEFREQVKPFAEKIARSRGVSIVLLADQSVFWLDPVADITDEVIAELRAVDAFADAGTDSDQAAATPPTGEPVGEEAAESE